MPYWCRHYNEDQLTPQCTGTTDSVGLETVSSYILQWLRLIYTRWFWTCLDNLSRYFILSNTDQTTDHGLLSMIILLVWAIKTHWKRIKDPFEKCRLLRWLMKLPTCVLSFLLEENAIVSITIDYATSMLPEFSPVWLRIFNYSLSGPGSLSLCFRPCLRTSRAGFRPPPLASPLFFAISFFVKFSV